MSTFDFVFAWEGSSGALGPWSELAVAELRGSEPISGLYRYDITLFAASPSPAPLPAELVGQRATLRINTLSLPAYKVVHGVITEARELGASPAGGSFVAVTLMPPIARARLRRKSRIFLDKTPRQIIEAVLKGDPRMTHLPDGSVEDDLGSPLFSPAEERFTWRILDSSRLDDARVRAYCVQYGESDFDFVSRLLEEEGISYHVENGDGRCLLVLTDHDGGRPRLTPALVGPGIAGRHVAQFRLGARQRPGAVVLDDHNWKKPSTVMLASASGALGSADLVEYVYPGRYPDAPAQGAPLSKARAERHGVEAAYALGEGTIRTLSAGTIVALAHPRLRYEGEYLITELNVRGHQKGVGFAPQGADALEPFTASFTCARRGRGLDVEESRFRPARSTPRPRIAGTETAIVTAEPSAKGAEIHVGGPDGLSQGCVRLKFHWDNDEERHNKEPTSCWVRVSQVFGGAGEGAVWHPRVGTEVIVDYEEGDPDRPLVIGRVYNGKNLPPYSGSPVHSTFKSFSSPGGAVFNELTFDDTAGRELMFMNAGKDMTSIVGNDRLEDVTTNAYMKVGIDDTEIIGANEVVSIGVNDTLSIGANDTLVVGANSTTQIAADCSTTIGATQSKVIGASQTISVGASLTEEVGGAVTETYGATRTTAVTGAITETLGASRLVKVAGSNTQSYGTHVLLVLGDRTVDVGGSLSTTVGGVVLQLVLGSVTNTIAGTETTTAGVGMLFAGPMYQLHTGSSNDKDGVRIKLTGAAISLVGSDSKENTQTFSMSSMSASATAVSLDLTPTKFKYVKSEGRSPGLRICMAGLYLHVHGFTCVV